MFRALAVWRHDGHSHGMVSGTGGLEGRSGADCRADWNYDRAAHLLAHAGFGGTPAEIQKLADAGVERAVRSLVHYESIPNPRMQPFVESGFWDPG